MEFEYSNIPYRKLRDASRGKTGKFSLSLLGSIPKNKKKLANRKNQQKLEINIKNVNQYQYLLKDRSFDNSNIGWITRLRIHDQNIPQYDLDLFNPLVSKNTKCFSNHLQAKKQKENIYNLGEFDQIFKSKGRLAMTQPQLIEFMTNLRTYEIKKKKQKQNKQNQNQVNKNKQKKQILRKPFHLFPFKGNDSSPKFLNKNSITKLKNITQKDLENAVDGDHKYAPYTQKILKQRNSSVINVFLRKNSRPSLPTLAWQFGLRGHSK